MAMKAIIDCLVLSKPIMTSKKRRRLPPTFTRVTRRNASPIAIARIAHSTRYRQTNFTSRIRNILLLFPMRAE